MNTNERTTLETDSYKGTHETHRIGGKTIYDHAEHLKRQRDEARDRIAQLEKQLAELQKPKEPETFEAHGLTWIKHMPGDKQPCDDETNVRVLLASEFKSGRDYYAVNAKAYWWNWLETQSNEGQIIGWNYADAL